jgi:uncharacterized FlgJ-related protein
LLGACAYVPQRPIEDRDYGEEVYQALTLGGWTDDCIQVCPVSPVMARIIVAQARVESGNFQSKLFREHRNAFGMMHAALRPTTSLGPLAWAEGRPGYASYRDVHDSALDLLLWLRYFGIKETNSVSNYCKQLKQNYYYGSSLKHYTLAVTKHLE